MLVLSHFVGDVGRLARSDNGKQGFGHLHKLRVEQLVGLGVGGAKGHHRRHAPHQCDHTDQQANQTPTQGISLQHAPHRGASSTR